MLLISAEESGGGRKVPVAGAEGATAPETLRPMDRGELALWKEAFAQAHAHRRG